MSFNNNIPNISINDEIIEKLYMLTENMLKINQKMNLTAIKDEKLIVLRHYVDSVFVSEHVDKNSNIIDIGCGAGFPTLPLAIFRPDIKITAVDSTAKRINYLNDAAKLLDLDNVVGISERAEVLGNNLDFREKYNYATARAVANLQILSELCLPFVKPGGKFLAMKSLKGDEELAMAQNAIKNCGGKYENLIEKALIHENGEIEARSIIIISKNKITPNEYPRHYSKISKKPL